jgi:ABC-type glycerol-3-phosphate transport system permease component
MRGVFRSIPHELEEASEIDGAGVFATWWKIMLPIASNGVSVVMIFSFYNIWGEYILAKTLATQASAMPLTVGLTLLRGEGWSYGILVERYSCRLYPGGNFYDLPETIG